MPPLEYPSDWKFDPPSIAMPHTAHHAFLELVQKIASGQSKKQVFETFKRSFGNTSTSSTASWAEEDMGRAMSSALDDAIAYLAQFWSALDELQTENVPVPSAKVLNRILLSNDVPLVIDPPDLRLASADAVVVSAETAQAAARPERIVLGDQLGHGGFGVVYRATRTTSVATFEYALKVLHPSPFVEDHVKAAARFTRESRILQRLQHRAVVPYIETGMMNETQAYILMPLIQGGTMRETPMDIERILWTFEEVLAGLAYLHEQQVLHRDLKPSNIIIRQSDLQPIILDFGCAYLFDDIGETTLTTGAVGSAAYIPPEVLADPTRRDARQDVYACGIMLYEMLRGHRPDPDEYSPLAKSDEGLASLDRLVKDAIAPFSKRLPKAQDFLDRLRRVSSDDRAQRRREEDTNV